MSLYILADTFFISKAVGSNGITALNLVLNILATIGGIVVALGASVAGATLGLGAIYVVLCFISVILQIIITVSIQQNISYNILIFKYLSIFKNLFFGKNIKKSAILTYHRIAD